MTNDTDLLHQVRTTLQFSRKPYEWQSNYLRLGTTNPQAAALADVGTGKTAAVIAVLRCRSLTGMSRILVLTPSVAIGNWGDELKKYSLPGELPPTIKLDVPAKRVAKLQEIITYKQGGVVVLNYEALDSKEILALLLKWRPEIVVADELHLIKNHMSKRSRAVVTLGEVALYRYGLTGTAVLQNEMDIYMQWRFLDKGESFGRNITEFRAKWCIQKTVRFGVREFVEWSFNPAKLEEFQKLLLRYAMIVPKETVLELPKQEPHLIELELTPEQKTAYTAMARDYLTFVNGRAAVATIALVKGLRLLQICSGHVSLDPVPGQEDNLHVFPVNPKIEWLRKTLPEVCKDHKIIIWTCFNQNIEDLVRLMNDLAIPAVVLRGGMTAKEKAAVTKQFQEDQETRIMISNRKAGGIAVNMTAASKSYIFSRNHSLGEELQSDGRNHRGGSEIHAEIDKYDLVCKGTIEYAVREAVQNKKNKSDMLLDLKAALKYSLDHPEAL